MSSRSLARRIALLVPVFAIPALIAYSIIRIRKKNKLAKYSHLPGPPIEECDGQLRKVREDGEEEEQ